MFLLKEEIQCDKNPVRKKTRQHNSDCAAMQLLWVNSKTGGPKAVFQHVQFTHGFINSPSVEYRTYSIWLSVN